MISIPNDLIDNLSKISLDIRTLAKIEKENNGVHRILFELVSKYIDDILIYSSLHKMDHVLVSGSMSTEEVEKYMLLTNQQKPNEEVWNYGYWFAMKRKNISFYERAIEDAARTLKVTITRKIRSRYSIFKDKIEYDMTSSKENYYKFDAWWKQQFKNLEKL